jgi:hypothetical protein
VAILLVFTGLLIATMLVMGWCAGSKFVCVFLSLPVGLVALICAAQAKQDMWGGFLLCVVVLGAIWAPRIYRQEVLRRQPTLLSTAHETSWHGTRWSSRP